MDNRNNHDEHNEQICDLVNYVTDPDGYFSESDPSDSVSRDIADRVNILLVKPGVPERFRNNCMALATAHRIYREKERLNDFQISGNCMAVSHVSGLKGKKAKPGNAQEVIEYLRNFFPDFAKIRIKESSICFYEAGIFENDSLTWESLLQQKDDPTVKQLLRIGHLEQCLDWLESLDAKDICWERDEWTVVGHDWDACVNGDNVSQTAIGWGIKLKYADWVPIEESVWPYYTVGRWRRDIVTKQRNLHKQERTARHPETETDRDLPAMYMLLSLVHSWEYMPSVIITKDIIAEAPDFGEEGLIGGRIKDIEKSSYRKFAADLKTAINHVKNDLDKGDVESPSDQAKTANNPTDLITLAVAVKRFHVSRATIKRRIESNEIATYRPANSAKNAKHLVSESEVRKIYPQK